MNSNEKIEKLLRAVSPVFTISDVPKIFPAATLNSVEEFLDHEGWSTIPYICYLGNIINRMTEALACVVATKGSDEQLDQIEFSCKSADGSTFANDPIPADIPEDMLFFTAE